jgi:heme-degrading monooxygenase HmoA
LQDGFLGLTSVRGADGAGFTASYWANLNSIRAWGSHPRHREVQRLGRERFYESFKTSLARLELN